MRPASTLLFLFHLAASYDLVRDYSGQHFFNAWDFYGSWDNLTLGDVWWLDEANATASGIATINPAGNAVIKVDNQSYVPFDQKRNSVRITSQDSYDFGSLWVIDLVHIPYGCSVWPAFWTFGPDWPINGEIDIIEAVNLMPNNQMALHTTPGCFQSTPPGSQTGFSGETDCSPGSGCTVTEASPNSFESGFAAAGGGVWGTQFDVSGIFIWFWSRPNIPESILQSTNSTALNISDWGTPSAAYPAGPSCNITEFFGSQQLVLDITLCGDWAGIGPVYNATCGNFGPTGLCYNDCVVGPGSPTYDEAYFEVSYIRAYTTPVLTSTPIPSPTSSDDIADPTSVTSNTPSTTSTTSSSSTLPTPTATAHSAAHTIIPFGERSGIPWTDMRRLPGWACWCIVFASFLVASW